MKQDSLSLRFPVPFPMRAERRRILKQILHARLSEVEQVLEAHRAGENPLDAPDTDYIDWVAGMAVIKRRLRAALSRLENFGSYGRCCRCNLEIEIKVLLLFPLKRTCRICDHNEHVAYLEAAAEKAKPDIFR
jgi:RNA polymerase-binding transcription factor DksA